MLHTILSMPIAFVANVVVARVLGPGGYGSLALLTAALTAAMVVANFGFTSATVQWGAAAEAAGDRAETRRLLARSSGFHLLVELPLLLLMGLVLLRNENLWLQLAFSGGLVLLMAVETATIALQTQNRTATAARIAIVANLPIQTAVVVAAVTSHSSQTVWVAKLAAGVVAPALALFVLSPHFRSAVLRPRLPRRMPDGFWRFGLGAWAALAVSLLVMSRSEIFVLRLFGRTTQLGVFALAFGISYQLTAPVDAILGPIVPAAAGLLAEHRQHARAGLLRGLRFSSIGAGAINALLLPPAALALTLFYGHRYSGAVALLVPLGLASTLQSVSHPVTALTLARRRGGFLFRVAAVALAADVVLAFSLIPVLGVWGAVVANVSAQCVSIVGLTVSELRVQALSWRDLERAVRAWTLSLLAVPVALGAGALLTGAMPRLAVAIASALVGAGTYAAGLRLTGPALGGGDAAVVLETLPASLSPVTRRVLSLLGISPAGVSEQTAPGSSPTSQ